MAFATKDQVRYHAGLKQGDTDFDTEFDQFIAESDDWITQKETYYKVTLGGTTRTKLSSLYAAYLFRQANYTAGSEEEDRVATALLKEATDKMDLAIHEQLDYKSYVAVSND